MATAGSVVHCRLTNFAQAVSFQHELVDFTDAFDRHYGQVLNKDAFLWILLQIKFLVWVDTKQVSDLLVIDLYVAASYEELFFYVRLVIYVAVDVAEGVRDDTLLFLGSQAKHGMSLATACLPISKNGPIIPTNNWFNQWESCLVIDCSLGRVRAVNGIISENFLLRTSFFIRTDNNLVGYFINVADALAAAFCFFRVHGTTTYHDFNTLTGHNC